MDKNTIIRRYTCINSEHPQNLTVYVLKDTIKIKRFRSQAVAYNVDNHK